MANRKKIGLYFVFDNSSNSGVVNYLFSIVKGLNTLADNKKPHLVIFHSENAPVELIKAEKYPFITFSLAKVYLRVPVDIFSRIVNKLALLFTGKVLIMEKNESADFLFPFPDNNAFNEIKGKVHWLVDFNPYYFPDHLSPDQRKSYFDHAKKVVYSKDKVVLSSFDIFKDLKKFHPDYTCKVEILRFAAVLPPFDHVNGTETKEKFAIEHPYVMTPNQFWVHKNHMLMLKAAKILKEKGLRFHMVFTGSTKVEEGSDYYPSLLQYIADHNLASEIRILGIVDRAEQLRLMKDSEVLVQPSLFEGWSTLVEESKALNKHIVVSDLPIHREQIDFNCTFFNPENENELADILETVFQKGVQVTPHDYKEDIANYANRILEIFN